jgi:hypothetical protein
MQAEFLEMLISSAVSLVIETNLFGIFIFSIFKHIKRPQRNSSTSTFHQTMIIHPLAIRSYHYDSRDKLNLLTLLWGILGSSNFENVEGLLLVRRAILI